MKLLKKQFLVGAAISASILLSACGGSSGDSNVATDFTSNDFEFPSVTATNGIEVPTGAVPDFSVRRTLSKGTGSTVQFGDPVVISYNMYSWATGELVDSSDTLDEPVTVRAGVTNGVPEYLAKSLLGRQIGDTLQLIFEQDMEDLPEYLDKSDAYVVVVNLL